MDKWGRKGGVIYCSSLSIFGGVLLCASQNIGMFIAFRFFAGAGSWGFLALSKLRFSIIEIPQLTFTSTCIYR
jgi:MFS family permease